MRHEEWLANCLLYFALSRWEGWFLVDFGTNVELIEATFTGLWAALASLFSRTFLWRCQTKMHSKLNMCVCVCVRGGSIKRYAAIFPSSLHLHPSSILTSGAACCYETDITAAVCLRQAFIIYLFRFSLCDNFRTFFFWCWVSEKIYRFHPSQLQLKVLGWSVSSYFLSLHSLHSKYTPPAQPACLGVIVIISKRHTGFFFFFFLVLEHHFYSCSSLTRQILVISLEQKNKKEKGSVNIMSGQIKYQAWVLNTLFSCFVTG